MARPLLAGMLALSVMSAHLAFAQDRPQSSHQSPPSFPFISFSTARTEGAHSTNMNPAWPGPSAFTTTRLGNGRFTPLYPCPLSHLLLTAPHVMSEMELDDRS